jgi:hypothetical protein
MNPRLLFQFPLIRALALLLLGGTLLAGCAAVSVRPEGELPKPLVVATPAKVAVVVTPEAANYPHKETRASVDYEAQLGPAHRQLIEEIFRAEFREAKFFDSLDAARQEPGLHAIFEPRIEQFSFANAKETGGVYCAVTIRYQIHIYAPDGKQVDTLTLTGYGSGPAPKIGNGEEELAVAAYAAMRDAAAKFLVQFPTLDVAKPLLASQPLAPRAEPAAGSAEAMAAAASTSVIEMVPINDPPVVATPADPSISSPPAMPGQTPEPNPGQAPADPAPTAPQAAPESPVPPSQVSPSPVATL